MKKYVKAALSAVLCALAVDGIFAADVEPGQFTVEEKKSITEFCYSACGNDFFTSFLKENLGNNFAQYFKKENFVSSARQERGAPFLRCIISKVNDDDRTIFAEFAIDLIPEAKYFELTVLNALIEHPVTHAVLRGPAAQNFQSLLSSGLGRQFVEKFAEMDGAFRMLVAKMSSDTLQAILTVQYDGAPRYDALEKIIADDLAMASQLGALFKADKKLIESYRGQRLLIKLISIDSSLATIATGVRTDDSEVEGFDDATIKTLLETDMGKDLLVQCLVTQLAKPGFWAHFPDSLMLEKIISDDKSNVVSRNQDTLINRLIDNVNAQPSLTEFATEYFRSLAITKQGASFLEKLAGKNPDFAPQVLGYAGNSLSEICQLKEGRQLIITLVKAGVDEAFIQNVDVEQILSLREDCPYGVRADSGYDVLKAIIDQSDEARTFFRKKFADQFSEDCKKIEELSDGKAFFAYLKK